MVCITRWVLGGRYECTHRLAWVFPCQTSWCPAVSSPCWSASHPEARSSLACDCDAAALWGSPRSTSGTSLPASPVRLLSTKPKSTVIQCINMNVAGFRGGNVWLTSRVRKLLLLLRVGSLQTRSIELLNSSNRLLLSRNCCKHSKLGKMSQTYTKQRWVYFRVKIQHLRTFPARSAVCACLSELRSKSPIVCSVFSWLMVVASGNTFFSDVKLWRRFSLGNFSIESRNCCSCFSWAIATNTKQQQHSNSLNLETAAKKCH